MDGTAVLGRLTRQVGQVVETRVETSEAKSLLLDLPTRPGHRAGQHVDIRATAEDGYQAVRSYSIASPPEERRVAVTIERLEDGEVSPYLNDEVRVGDPLELRSPYICSPTPFAEGAANGLLALGYEPERIRIERFGPTGR